MKSHKLFLALMLVMSILIPMGYATEQMAIPKMSASEATPSITATTGTISLIDVNSKTPNLKISDANGNSTTVQIDIATTSAWKMGKMLPLAQLKAGDKVKVRRSVVNGKDVAKSIEVM